VKAVFGFDRDTQQAHNNSTHPKFDIHVIGEIGSTVVT
jgi:hypothetical protein